MKREQERQKSEVALSIPEDHPVRKLFQKFRQQRDTQTTEESHFDHNCIQMEALHQPASDVDSCQPADALPEEDKTAQQTFEHPEKTKQSCIQVTVESRPRHCQQSSAGGAPARGRGARGWARFKAPAPAEAIHPSVEEEQDASQTSEQETEEGLEGGSAAGEAGDQTSLMHKTDSCDSGITKSDLRIDRAGDVRSSFERSPMERSPLERSPFEHNLGVYTEVSIRQAFMQPASEQTLLQASLHEAKLELKGDIRRLSSRLSLLESQVSEILRLLTAKRRLSLPPVSARARMRSQDWVTSSPKMED